MVMVDSCGCSVVGGLADADMACTQCLVYWVLSTIGSNRLLEAVGRQRLNHTTYIEGLHHVGAALEKGDGLLGVGDFVDHQQGGEPGQVVAVGNQFGVDKDEL